MGGGSPSQGRTSEGFERVFDLVGGHGLFQWRLMFIVSLQLIILTWHHIGYAFLGSVPDHWCDITELHESNWTLEQIKLISIPHERISEGSELKFSKCEHYHLNYGSLLESSSSWEEAYSKVSFENVTTKHCTRWAYNHSIYHSTVATQFDLVCENRWMAATIQGSYMAGGLVGTLTFGAMSDRFLGRRKTVLISVSIVVVAGILASFANSYWMFLLLRFFVSIGVAGSMQNCFVLITEHADKSYRALMGMVTQVPFAIGYMLLPGLAYFLRDWDKLQLSFGIISCGLIVYYWILPDSPRWLATHAKYDKAVVYLNKMAKVNSYPEPRREDLIEILRICNEADNHNLHQQQNSLALPTGDTAAPEVNNGTIGSSASGDKKSPSKFGVIASTARKWMKGFARNFMNLMRTAEIRKRSLVFWFLFATVAMVYYGIVFSGNLTSDPYLLVFLGGLMEVPAYTLMVPFVSRLGRRPTTAGTFMITGICMLGLTRTPAEYDIVRIVLAMSAKLFVSSGFAIIYLLGAELYPTELRTTGLAVGVFMGRIGAISAPYIVDLMQTVYPDLPTLIFGGFAICGGFVALLLPETKTLEMSDKVVEIELQAEGERIKSRKQSMMETS